jgi:hypothetical protein
MLFKDDDTPPTSKEEAWAKRVRPSPEEVRPRQSFALVNYGDVGVDHLSRDRCCSQRVR